ncbi:MAG: hypothetical protein ACQKBU_02805, partial [Verrucomicrobiales bacterium]
GINASYTHSWALDNNSSLPDYDHPDNIQDATRLEQTAKPDSMAWGALGFVTQADLLQSIGPALTVRSDTFTIRAYGNSLSSSGETVSEAWCEAVVQRMPEPVNPDESGLNPEMDEGVDFGRRIVMTKFRWLSRDEI